MESRKVILASLLMITAVLAVTAEVNGAEAPKKKPRVVYAAKTELDLEGTRIEGEVRNPGEFYFQHRAEEKFDSLVKRRKNFHREMMRDAVLSR